MKKRFTSETMKYIQYLSWPAISADGDRLAYVKSVGNEEDGLFRQSVHLMDAQSGKAQCLTEDGVSEKQPVFLADGDRMTYLSNASGQWQLYIKDINTGEAKQVTTLRHGVIRYNLTDDGSKAVFEATLWPEDLEKNQAFAEMNEEEAVAWAAELDWRPYEITNLTYKMDEWYGMRKGEYSHIGVLDLETGQQTIIDTKGMEAIRPNWSHDGSRVAFYGYPYDGAKGRQAEIFVCYADGSDLQQMSSDLGLYPDHAPVFTMDDHAVIGVGFPPFEDGSCIMLPYQIDLATKQAELLIDEWDEEICHGLQPLVANRTEYGENPSYFKLTKEGEEMYFLSSFHGRSNIYKINIKEKTKIQLVLKGDTDIHGFAMTEEKRFAYVMGNPQMPAELYFDGERMTDSNPWLQEYALGKFEKHWTKSRDGKVDLQWFMIYPADYEKGKKYPAVLDIKGGPETIYTMNFWHEFQALAEKGFVVIYGNPRGSVGYGREFCANAVCWCNEAMEDMLAIVDAAVETGIVDKDRIGVTGGSYGGYMTNKLIGRTDYFAAAVTQRSLVNPVTSYGTGDMGFISARPVPADFKMKAYLEDRAKGNIISYVDNIKVPLLILHAFKDYRCSFEQAEQLFIPMKERNPEVPVRLVMFPEENHALTRTGKLYNQIRHLSELVDWFDQYLNKGGEADE